jgi:aerobic carbon-monoxide dehydrogenase large subunit
LEMQETEESSSWLITGKGKFVDDIRKDQMLHLKIVRSPYARARILSVKGGITGAEFKANVAAVGEGAWGAGGYVSVPYPALASDYVSYAGQPVAAVVADDPYKAEDMMEEVEVEYDSLKPLVNPEDALDFEPIHPNIKSNLVSRVQLGKEFDEKAPVVLEDELLNERVIPNPIEPRGLVAHYDGSKLTVWASTQSVHSWKSGLCLAMRLPREKVRVVEMDTGGAFGCKSALYPEYAVACYASMKTGRPVKWIETRSEHLQATSQGRGARGRMKVYAERSGRVLGVKGDVLVDSGAFALGVGAMSGRFIGFQLTGPYAIENALVDATNVFTNKVPAGPYRGAGRPEAAFFVERMMDLLADELKLDPVEVRLRNASPTPIVSPLGMKLDAFQPFLKSAARALGYAGREKTGAFGFSSFVLMSSVQPGESSRVTVKDGKVKVWIGSSPGGQGHDTIAKVVLSEELGVPESVVELEAGDTDQLDQGIGTWGSRSAVVIRDALMEAAGKIREQATAAGCSPEELLEHEFEVTVFHRETDQENSFGAYLVRASLTDEGEARVEECTAFHDVGRAINPQMVESQVVGGCAQGIGQVLFENTKYNEDGQQLVGTIADAGLVLAPSMPHVTMRLAEDESGPLSRRRVKGVGEAPTVGVPPALVRALEVALGRRLRRTPLSPEDLRR